MSEASVFQSIENVLLRIEEIKNKYGVKSSVHYPGFDGILRTEIDKNKNIEVGETQRAAELSSVSQERNETVEKAVSPEYEDIIKAASEQYKVPESLIKAVIQQESNFQPTAVSKKGALGLMQLMPETAELLGVNDPFDAAENIFGGTRYLRNLINMYGGNLNKALAAYNAGPRRVQDDIPNIPETKDFIQSVLNYYDNFSVYQNTEGF
jgi:soluble lytic murein transglycosylase-like protein